MEIGFSLERVWAAIPEAVGGLGWTVEQRDDRAHCVEVRTKARFLSYSSKLTIQGVSVDEKVCRLRVEAETPVTTITAVADFGSTKDRIHQFLGALARQLSVGEKS